MSCEREHGVLHHKSLCDLAFQIHSCSERYNEDHREADCITPETSFFGLDLAEYRMEVCIGDFVFGRCIVSTVTKDDTFQKYVERVFAELDDIWFQFPHGFFFGYVADDLSYHV